MRDSPAALDIERLNVAYGRRRVLSDISIGPLQGGAITALVGPNAAGKSTLLRALAGVLGAQGRVRLDGEELLAMSLRERAGRLAFMPQSLPASVELSVLECVTHALRAAPVETPLAESAPRQAARTLERLGLEALALRRMDELSGGQRQMVSLAQSLVRRPRLLLLDEPTSALDLRHQVEVMSAVRDFAARNGAVVLAVLHDLSLAARWAGHMIVMARGALYASGAPEATITPKMLAEVYEVEARVEHCSRGTLQPIIDGLIDAGPATERRFWREGGEGV